MEPFKYPGKIQIPRKLVEGVPPASAIAPLRGGPSRSTPPARTLVDGLTPIPPADFRGTPIFAELYHERNRERIDELNTTINRAFEQMATAFKPVLDGWAKAFVQMSAEVDKTFAYGSVSTVVPSSVRYPAQIRVARREARTIVRTGLADVLAWLGETP